MPAVTKPLSSVSDPALDRDHLHRQTLGDRALQAELLELFANQARDILHGIRAAGQDDTSGRARREALFHLLCGSARAVGAWDVAGQAQALERDPGADAGLPALEQAVERVCAAICEVGAEMLASGSPELASTRR